MGYCNHSILTLKQEIERPCGWVRRQYICQHCNRIFEVSVKGSYWFPVPIEDLESESR